MTVKRKFAVIIAVCVTLFAGVTAEAEDYSDLVERVMPSIVLIKTDTRTGSGFFVSSEGDILTNYHVVDGARFITVALQNGSSLQASLKSYDAKKDMALLAVNVSYSVKFLKISAKLPRQGEAVIAISSPRGLSGTVKNGIVSAFRDNKSWVQFTAPVSPGSSGGALLNLNGEIVGMITANLKGEGQNLNFAIAPAILAEFVKEAGKGDVYLLARNGTPEQLKAARKKGANFNVSRKSYDDETGKELYTEEFDYAETPLHLAAMHNRNAGSIKFLISQGLDVNARASSGNSVVETPLSCAVKSKNINAVKALLKAGANPHTWSTGNNGSMFHIVASEYRNYSEAKAVVAELVKAKGNVNFHHEFTLTQEEINHWIPLDAKADPNIRNLEGKTALDYAMLMPDWTNLKRSEAFKRLKTLTACKSSRR